MSNCVYESRTQELIQVDNLKHRVSICYQTAWCDQKDLEKKAPRNESWNPPPTTG